jgi:secreted trypsin-like serine protease
VIGGYDARGGEFPWHTDLGGCGGTIIDSHHIITAAHCVYPNDNGGVNKGSFVYAGNLKPGKSEDNEFDEWGNLVTETPTPAPVPSAEQRLKVIQVQSHACYCPNFSSNCPPSDDCSHERNPVMNDIALLTTEQPFKFDEIVQPICLPEKNEIFEKGDTV